MAIAVIKEQIRLQGLRRKVYDSYDYAEGIQAFKEKRKPQYRGE